MLDVLSGLQNITDYHIMWYGLPTIHQSPTPFLVTAFQPNLRKLSMEVSLENLEKLVSVTGVLDNLEELDIFFRVDGSDSPVDHTAIMTNYLAPFINHLHPTLQYFAIQSWEPLDFSPLFRALQFFPVLKRFSIAIPNSSPHLGDPSGLRDLLTRQSETLRHLTLRCTQFSGAGLIADENPVHEWMQKVLCDVTIAGLQTLEVGLGLFPIETAIMCLQRFAKTLLSLVLTGRYLTYEQISTAVSTFAHCHADAGLKTLRLGPLTLSPQLVDLLAEKLPGLGRLELLIREVVPQEGDLPVYYIAPNPDHNQDEDQIVRSKTCNSPASANCMTPLHRNCISPRWRNDSIHIGCFVISHSPGVPSLIASSTSCNTCNCSRSVYQPFNASPDMCIWSVFFPMDSSILFIRFPPPMSRCSHVHARVFVLGPVLGLLHLN